MTKSLSTDSVVKKHQPATQDIKLFVSKENCHEGKFGDF